MKDHITTLVTVLGITGGIVSALLWAVAIRSPEFVLAALAGTI